MVNFRDPVDPMYAAPLLEMQRPLIYTVLGDTSTSMPGESIRMVNEALSGLGRAFSMNENAVNICAGLITFGEIVNLATPYRPVSNLGFPLLKADGSTPFGSAVNNAIDAIDAIEATVTYFRVNGVTTIRRPVLTILSDGRPTDEWQSAANRRSAGGLDHCVS